ncbi:MAG TPA: Arc family DNA-binding protein [Ktedonobacteraceae bacterium]|nr:Arc family DNA-binding protein [Ktedonobacteraceae bacterium]
MQEKRLKTNKTTVYLPPDVQERLKASAKRNRRSFNAELVWAIQQYLEREQKDKQQ